MPSSTIAFDMLMNDVRACTLCAPQLPHPPRPVLQAHPDARILIAGQAPGRRVHQSGVPFADASGDRLRAWMGVPSDTFYDQRRVAIVPMGFCYPGSGRSGDLPPRPECAATWRERVLRGLSKIRLTLVIGQYAHAFHLGGRATSLTDTVRAWRDFGGGLIPLPHPSPRNGIWLRRNPWFEAELLPVLKQRVASALQAGAGGD